MKIEQISVSNYRILDGLCVSFNNANNYIVGKNNIGKTCMLNLLETILNGKDFRDTDFSDVTKPIKIRTKIRLSEEELGIFSDNFSTEDSNIANLVFQQESPEERSELISSDSGEHIAYNQIKTSNFVFYSSNIKPIAENDLTFNGSNYKLVPELVKTYMSNHKKVSADPESYEQNLLDFINTNLFKVKLFKENEIQVGINNNYEELITRSLTIKSKDGIDFAQLGFGLQFSSLIPLKIIDKIVYWSRYNKLKQHLIIHNDGTNTLNIILGLDEPEVHLHPNLQLQLMDYIRNIISGKDSNFNSLLHELFGIDRIKGQIIAVTHSPKILSTDYHEIIRFTTNQGKVFAALGNILSLDTREDKQLKRQFPYFADALFSDGVILVEGDTEQTAIPVLAATLKISLVNNNINVIRTDGIESMKSLAKLLASLNINTVCIEDSDGERTSDECQGIFVTTGNDFEEDCFEKMTLFEINHYINDYHLFIKGDEYKPNFWREYLPSKYLSDLFKEGDCVKKIDKILKDLQSDKNKILKQRIKEKFITNYLKDKSIINGEIIAQNISNVPDTYAKAIRKIINDER